MFLPLSRMACSGPVTARSFGMSDLDMILGGFCAK